MGNVFRGIPVEMTKRLQSNSGARLFIETGTQKGLSVQAVAGLFDRIITIEANPAVHAEAKQALAHLRHAACLLGRSEQVLKKLAADLEEPAILWLDAHALRGASGADFCALPGELAALAACPVPPIIMIDDAHNFGNGRQGWPTLNAVRAALAKIGAGYHTFEETDVLVCVPKALEVQDDSRDVGRDRDGAEPAGDSGGVDSEPGGEPVVSVDDDRAAGADGDPGGSSPRRRANPAGGGKKRSRSRTKRQGAGGAGEPGEE